MNRDVPSSMAYPAQGTQFTSCGFSQLIRDKSLMGSMGTIGALVLLPTATRHDRMHRRRIMATSTRGTDSQLRFDQRARSNTRRDHREALPNRPSI
jgi:hypothetical protein